MSRTFGEGTFGSGTFGGDSATGGTPARVPGVPVKLEPFGVGLGLDVTPGLTGTVPLVPVSEPQVVGFAPVAPDLVRQVTAGAAVRAIRCASGHVRTMPLDVAGSERPRWRVTWTALTREERDALLEFVESLSGTLLGWLLAPDGEGTLPRPVRFVEEPRVVYAQLNAATVPALDVEELL